MSKIIALGDTHGWDSWKKVINNETFDEVVFVGDYFDSFDKNTDEQINNFLDIIAFKESSDKRVVLLIGNHDHHYFPEVGNTGTSGYQSLGHLMIEPVLDKHRGHLLMAYQKDNLLFSHAGVGESFMDACFGKGGWHRDKIADDLNDLWRHKPLAFTFNGRDFSGDDMGQTPIWIRPRSLMRDSQELKKSLIQIVGHTAQRTIDIEGKATGKKYFFIDTMGVGEYLIIENGEFKRGKYDKG